MKNLFLGLFLFMTMTRCRAQSGDGVSSTCSYVTVSSYIEAPSVVRGWPVSLKCDYLISDFLYEPSLVLDDDSVLKLTCQMHIDGELVYKSTGSISSLDFDYPGPPFTLPALDRNTTIQLSLESRGFCGVTNVTLVPLEPTHMYGSTCEEANAKEIERNRIVSIDRTCDVTALRLDCEPDGYDPPLVRRFHQRNVTWYRNCIPMDPSEYTTVKPIALQTVTSIIIEDEKKFSSEFTCKVTYNGLTRFLRFQHICMTPPATNRYAIMEPTQEVVYAKPGDDVILSCGGSGYAWAGSSGSLVYSWVNGIQFEGNETNRLCEFNEIPKNETSNQKYVCDRQLGLHQSSAACFSSNGSCSSFNRFNSTLIIRNVTESEFGEYSCVAGITTVSKNATILLKPVLDPPPVTQLVLVLSIIGAFLIIVIICGVALWIWIVEAQLIWKKHFAAFEKHDHLYSVFLTYSYQNNADDESKELLELLHKWFAGNNYTVFDEHRDQSGGYRYEMVKKVASDCHRMLVVLTPEFFEKDDKIFDVHTGILNYIDGKSTMIFVMTPESQQILHTKLKANDTICRTLAMAIHEKRNTVILWKGAEQSKGFFKRLDVAMPKLPPPAEVIRNNGV